MVVRHGKVVHGANHHHPVFHHGPVFGRVYAQNGGLGRVNDGGGQHGAKRAAIADREGAAGHLFNAQLAVARLDAVLGNFFLNLCKAHLVSIAQNRHHQTTWRAYRNANVKVAVVDDVIAIDRRIEQREFFQRMDCRLDEKAHEAQLDAVLFFKLFLHAFAHIHHRGHVDFVEGRQNGIGRL